MTTQPEAPEAAQEREAFERFARAAPLGSYSVDRKDRGYWSSHTQLMWDAWQARAAIAQHRAQEPVAEVECWEEWLGGDKPRQIYKLTQLDGFRALPSGTHKLYAATPHTKDATA
jgi:hypothetical protein